MPQTADLLITGGEIVSSRGRQRADVAVRDGLIAEVAPDLSAWRAERRHDATGHYVLPGLFDAHNHPYYDENLEQFSLAAAHGGITTLIPFVSGSRIGTDAVPEGIVGAAERFLEEVRTWSYLDCGGHAILSPDDDVEAALPALWDLGFSSYKVFLAFPGSRMLTDDQVFVAMCRIARAGGVCMIHCENGPVTDLLECQLRADGRVAGDDYLRSRPAQLEEEAVYRALSLAAIAQCPAYIVHISSQESLRIVEAFRQRGGPPIFAETCLHYLRITGQEQVKLGPRAKISPPCRSTEDRDGIWRHVLAGNVDVIATDASGQLLAKKEAAGSDYLSAPYGIPGVEEFFRVLIATAEDRGVDALPIVARTMAEEPARIFGLGARKGSIEVGKDADLTVFDPDADWTIRADSHHGRSDYSLYEGVSGKGSITWTYQRGRPVLADGTVVANPGDAVFLSGNASADSDLRHPASHDTSRKDRHA